MQALGDALVARGVEPATLRYVGSERGQEFSILGNGPISLTLLPGRGIRRSLSMHAFVANLGAIVGLVRAVVHAFFLVRRWRPAVVVSVGGYASFAVSFAAFLRRRPLVLVELDAAPGAAHRLFTRVATRRCSAFPSDDPRTVFTGAPIRATLTMIDRSPAAREAALARLSPSVDPARTVVVVMTGSLGASRVNDAVSELAARWATRRDVALIHVSGRRDYADVVRRAPLLEGLDYRVVEFGDMTELWQLCDVALCRSGALTVAELTALGIASVLVPLPGAPGDHQTKNATALVAAGAARLLRDEDCNANSLADVLEEVMEPTTLAAMARAAAALGHVDATQTIIDVVLAVGDAQ
jgi:UDP-N-acetylglucosamine--N-acetylmuramyl-(pentapeptide) pyrophosphoryl-undecaprenol N-acetylglucosamine transferase